jgi:hypothetical protein
MYGRVQSSVRNPRARIGKGRFGLCGRQSLAAVLRCCTTSGGGRKPNLVREITHVRERLAMPGRCREATP